MIDEESAKYLKENSLRPGPLYTIAKVHKQGNPGRPVVSSNAHPTERISQFVDHHLQPLVTKRHHPLPQQTQQHRPASPTCNTGCNIA